MLTETRVQVFKNESAFYLTETVNSFLSQNHIIEVINITWDAKDDGTLYAFITYKKGVV